MVALSKLPWVRYHEHPEAGHALPDMDEVGDKIIWELLLGDGKATSARMPELNAGKGW
jgi:hypothetical protein